MDIIKNTQEYDDTLKNNKAVFVDFYADWCGPCKMVSPLVEQVSTEFPQVKFVKVNVDNNPDIAQRYGIMSIPTLMAFKDGEQVSMTVGFKPKEDLENIVKEIA